MLAPSGGGLILYQAYGNLYAMTGRKTHLLEDKQIPSVGVFDEVFSTWMTFGGNTHDFAHLKINVRDYKTCTKIHPRSVFLERGRRQSQAIKRRSYIGRHSPSNALPSLFFLAIPLLKGEQQRTNFQIVRISGYTLEQATLTLLTSPRGKERRKLINQFSAATYLHPGYGAASLGMASFTEVTTPREANKCAPGSCQLPRPDRTHDSLLKQCLLIHPDLQLRRR
ncbi:hypothetical protein Tco_1175831 [Tanacetum coccineum]